MSKTKTKTKVQIDGQNHLVYLELRPKDKIEFSKRVLADVVLDFNKERQLLGIEFLDFFRKLDVFAAPKAKKEKNDEPKG